jgi:pimeloyl-ACP methyl ester carboxylesterase
MKKQIFLVVIFALFFFSYFQVRAQEIAQCTNLKVTTLPLGGEYGSYGQLAVTRQSVANPDAGAPAPISVFVPNNATAQNKVPVVFFAHGFGGFSYLFYEALLRQMASNGYIVVFSPYTSNVLTTHAARYNQLWSGFAAAVQQYGAIMDTSRVGFAGHSYGAGATPEMARRAVAQGWGANGLFMFIMAAWYNWGTNMQQIPANAKMVVQVYWNDGTNEHLISQNDIWNKLPQITERKWQVIKPSQTYCSLGAGHSLPVTNGLGQTDAALDAYDYWGVWRRLHALADYTFNGTQAAKPVAFGADSAMGKWRGIFASRRIAPLEAYDAPVLNSNLSPTWKWENKCAVADFGAACP